MSDEKLEALWVELAEVRLELLEGHKRVIRERDSRQNAKAAADRVAAMSDPERVALLQVLTADGVRSEEKVGEI